jgi:hypothetical protein
MRVAPVAVVPSMTVVSVPSMAAFRGMPGTFATGLHLYLTRELGIAGKGSYAAKE